jgi:SAM-dependent methyltransferase
MKMQLTTAPHEPLPDGLDEVPTLTELANMFGSDKGTKIGDWDTAHGYAPIYEHFLAARRSEPLRLLEIGVWKGASLRMWERYLPQARIVGVDILPEARQAASDRSQVVIGDASDPNFIRSIVDSCFDGTVDVVVDDGSHVLDQQLAALETLFPLLSEGGLYFVEDISVSRFDIKGVSRRPFFDFLDYAAWLAEQTTFWDGINSERYHTIRNLNSLTAVELDRIAPNYWNGWLHAVHQFYNMCVLEKRRQELPVAEVVLKPSVLSRSGGRTYALHGLQKRFREMESKRSNPLSELLTETKDKLAGLELQVTVATKLAEHGDSLPAAINAAVEGAQRQIGPFRDALRAMEHASLKLVEDLAQATAEAERAVTKLNHVEAEAEYLRDRLHKLQQTEGAAAGRLAVGDNAGRQIHQLQVQLAASEARCVEANARIDALETELARGSSEIAQIRLIHADLWDSYKSVRGELERSDTKCRTLEEETADLRQRAVESDTRIAAIYASTSWRVTAPLRWLKLVSSRHRQNI